jgi:hypothetical protein
MERLRMSQQVCRRMFGYALAALMSSEPNLPIDLRFWLRFPLNREIQSGRNRLEKLAQDWKCGVQLHRACAELNRSTK